MAQKEITQKKGKKLPWTLDRVLPYILIIGGIIGLAMAFIITQEKIQLLKDPNYVPPCSINPIISCGSVMKSSQAQVFGFANPFIGLAGFAVVITIGMAMLAGARFKRWFWLGLEAGALFGVGFVHWLMFQSLYRIQALCPYCMVVWTVTICTFLYTTLYNIRFGHIMVPEKLKGVANFTQKHHGDILIAWYLIIAFLILNHFWYYWKTLI
jgi:uncharacterized membrane protein